MVGWSGLCWWFVPHDVTGLLNLFGGEKEFGEKLYESFTNKQFPINNETDIAYPYLFRYVRGEKHRTDKLIHKIMCENFGADHNGLLGNDDCGTISARFIFSAMGFYPDCLATDYYTIGYPLFDKIIIKLNTDYYKGDSVTIEKQPKVYNQIYFNGSEIENYRLYHNLIVEGGTLLFK